MAVSDRRGHPARPTYIRQAGPRTIVQSVTVGGRRLLEDDSDLRLWSSGSPIQILTLPNS
jgi:hypothetical protein